MRSLLAVDDDEGAGSSGDADPVQATVRSEVRESKAGHAVHPLLNHTLPTEPQQRRKEGASPQDVDLVDACVDQWIGKDTLAFLHGRQHTQQAAGPPLHATSEGSAGPTDRMIASTLPTLDSYAQMNRRRELFLELLRLQ